MNINPTELKYFLYARKSNEGDDKQSKSIGDQIIEMNAFAERKGLTIIEIFSESKSAKSPNQRPVYSEMINRISQGEANGILTWKLNRLARNPVEGGQISWMLQNQMIKHIQTYSSQHWPYDNVLMMQFEFGMANQYSRDLSELVKRGQRRKAERGWYPGAVSPVGYIFNRNKKPNSNDPVILPDPVQFKLMRKVWEKMISERKSIKQIAKYGNEIGVKGYHGKSLAVSSYHRLLTNEFYCGYFTWKDESDILKKFKGQHTAMITEAEFQYVQDQLKEKCSSKKVKRYNFPFKGSIKCGECGCSITAEHKYQVICTRCKKKFSAKTRNACPYCGLLIDEMECPSIIDKTYYRCTKSSILD